MAQIEQSDNGKKKKGAQKKMSIHVDFTPMVDMNMLLITFFMLCTTMLKSQTLKIALPSNEKVQNEREKNQAAESQAITLLLDTERDENGQPKFTAEGKMKNIIYYYEGAPKVDPATGNPYPDQLKTEAFLGNENNVQRGIRKILSDRNKEVLKQIGELKEQWRNKAFSSDDAINDSIYDAKAKEVRNNKDLKSPIVMIKATDVASWESVIGALDEMSISEISIYQIENLNDLDRKMLGLPVETPEAAPAQ